MLTYIGFAECGVIVGITSLLDGSFILRRLRVCLMKQNTMMARIAPAAAMPPMAEVLRPWWELEDDCPSAPVGFAVGQGVMVQLVLVGVGMEGV